MLKCTLVAGGAVFLWLQSVSPPLFAQGRQSAADCVNIGKPKPEATYVSQHTESESGKTTLVTHVWESVTETGSRVRWTAPSGTTTQVNEHHIVDDIAVLDRTSKLDANGTTLEATTFRPGVVGEPLFRACTGRTWQIPSVTAIFQSGTIKVTSATPSGVLRIVNVHARVSVPAGAFDTVHYFRAADEYWKSLEHGVVVKHLSKTGTNLISEALTAIR